MSDAPETKEPETNVEKFKRPVRSFVLRMGRMTAGQQHAMDSHWSSKGLLRETGVINYAQVFGRTAPIVLEIGFGMGASLVEMAEAAPQKDFIGIEVHRPGVGRLLHLMEAQGVENIRAYCDDAVEVLKQCIPDASLSCVQIFFPDPWHKKRHNKRRLIQPEFVQLLRQKLQVGGVIHLATDWQDYAEQMLEVMSAAEGFRNQVETGYAPRPESRPLTKFEMRGERLGHGVWDLLFEKAV